MRFNSSNWSNGPSIKSLVFAAFFIAAGLQPATASDTIFNVYPTALEGSGSVEIGALVLLLMPDSDAKAVGWNYRDRSPIKWHGSGYETQHWADGETIYQRSGAVRVDIEGKKVTAETPQPIELGWTVTYQSNLKPEAGPMEIRIEPGITEDERFTCEGNKHSGCTFDAPLSSLSRAGITASPICHEQLRDSQLIEYELRKAGKRPTMMIWDTSGGSSQWSSITLKLNDPKVRNCRTIANNDSPNSAEADASDRAKPDLPSQYESQTVSTTRSKASSTLWTILLVPLALYLIPTIIAFGRDRHNKGAIFVLNLFLGWSVLGWVIALIWAVSSTRPTGQR